ncbi:MAG: endolytic transglycosylase MltG [Bacteroidetes bacterium]|nr:endolytic transglycosylase MltG [Bacteroidota bacterium]
MFKTYRVVSFLFFLSVFFVYHILFSQNILIRDKSKRFNIYPNSDVNAIIKNLDSNGFIKSKYTFRLAAFFLRYGKKINSGSYYIKSNSSNWTVIKMLRGGLQKPIKLVLYDINNKKTLIKTLCKNLNLKEEEITSLLNNDKFVKTYGFNKENILTMFIPNTYEIYWNISPKNLFKRFYSEYLKFWNPERIKKLLSLKLSKIEIFVLASIVQAETCKYFEAPTIAGVYINRLKRGIRLQADPTLKHAACKFNANRVLDKFKLIDSPYNTYKYKGLPPGPINMPQIKIIDAVLNYKKHKYLYMAAKEDFSGEHHFSETYSKHIIYARKYRKALNRYKIYK